MFFQSSYNAIFSEALSFLILCLYANLIYIKLRIQGSTVHPIESNRVIVLWLIYVCISTHHDSFRKIQLWTWIEVDIYAFLSYLAHILPLLVYPRKLPQNTSLIPEDAKDMSLSELM